MAHVKRDQIVHQGAGRSACSAGGAAHLHSRTLHSLHSLHSLHLCDRRLRQILDTAVGPFNFVQIVRAYVTPEKDSWAPLKNVHENRWRVRVCASLGCRAARVTHLANRLNSMSWRYRTLRGSVETDEKMLQQLTKAGLCAAVLLLQGGVCDMWPQAERAETNELLKWDLSVLLVEAMKVSAGTERACFGGGRGDILDVTVVFGCSVTCDANM